MSCIAEMFDDEESKSHDITCHPRGYPLCQPKGSSTATCLLALPSFPHMDFIFKACSGIEIVSRSWSGNHHKKWRGYLSSIVSGRCAWPIQRSSRSLNWMPNSCSILLPSGHLWNVNAAPPPSLDPWWRSLNCLAHRITPTMGFGCIKAWTSSQASNLTGHAPSPILMSRHQSIAAFRLVLALTWAISSFPARRSLLSCG